MAISGSLIAWTLQNVPRLEFGPRTYLITGGLAALYLLAGTLVWLGAPLGSVFSRICTLLYLARPNFGSAVWESMDLPEFKAHFDRRRKAS